MVTKTRNKALTRTWDFKSGAPVIEELPRDNMIRRLALHLVVTLTTAAGAAPAVGLKNSDILNLLKRIEVVLEGNDNIFDCDLRTYFEAIRFNYGTVCYKDAVAIPAAGESNTYNVEIPIDFAFDPHLISDTRALLPADVLGSLEMRLTWGTESDIFITPNATTITAASTGVSVSIIEVYDNGLGDNTLRAIRDGARKIYQGVQQDEFTEAHTSYPADQFEVQVRPIQAIHLQTIFCALDNITDGNPSYSNTVVTQIKLDNVKGGGEALFHDYFAPLQRIQKTDFGFEQDNPVGRVMIDYVDIRNGGLLNNDPDALKWKFLTATPTAGKTNAMRAFKRYMPTG